MIAEEVSKRDWIKFCEQAKFKNIFGQSDFIEAYCDVYELTPHYFIVKENCTPRVALACFSKKKFIVIPTHYFFTPIWLDRTQGEIILNRAIGLLLNDLKLKFKKITLRLPVEITDLRPFYWHGFTGKQSYTYLKDLGNLNYHTNINRILKNDCPYIFEIGLWADELEDFHKKDLIAFGFRKGAINNIFRSFKKLREGGRILVVNAYEEDTLVGSDVLLMDACEKKAYMFFISKSGGHYKKGLHAYLYNYVFNYLKAEGYKTVDMFGANYQSISMFKSKFNPQLTPYHELRYSFFSHLFNRTKLKVKAFVIRKLQHFT